MGFVLFTNKRARGYTPGFRVRLGKKGMIGISKDILDEIAAGKMNVDLYYDPNFNRIGMIFQKSPTLYSFAVNKGANYISAKSFFDENKISQNYFSRTYNATLEKNMVVICLDEQGTIPGGRHEKSK